MDNIDVKITGFKLLKRTDDGERLRVELVVLELIDEGVKPREKECYDFRAK